MDDGWVKINRQILNKGWINKPEYVALWIHLLLQVTHKNIEKFWNGRTIILKPGQLITGRLKMAAATGIHRSKVDRILKCFESEQQIEQQMSNTSRLITVLNWKKYQDSEPPFEPQMSRKRAASEPRVSTKQEYINTNTNNTMSGRADRFVEFVNSTFDKNYKTGRKVIHDSFRARLETDKYPPELLAEVAMNVKNTTFHIESQYKYATPEFLLKQSTIEKYKSGPIVKPIFKTETVEPKPNQKYDEETNIYSGFK